MRTTLGAMDKLTIFIAVVSFAILLQAGILFALYMSVRRVQTAVEDVQRKALPIIEQGRELLTDISPKMRKISTHALETSAIVRQQAQEISHTVTVLNNKARIHIERADQLITDTVSKVERTTDKVQSKVLTPVRKVNGIMAAVSAAVDSLRGIERANTPRGYEDEGFIG